MFAITVDNFVHRSKILPVISSNVAAAQFLIDEQKMIVQYLDENKKPGQYYEYVGVSEQEAIYFVNAKSKGTACWDLFRIRGTKDGHKKPYNIVSGFKRIS